MKLTTANENPKSGSTTSAPGDLNDAPRAPLPVVMVDDLEAAQAAVERAGGKIVKPVFSLPGGRRFQFTDPNGLELAVMQSE